MELLFKETVHIYDLLLREIIFYTKYYSEFVMILIDNLTS